MNNVTELGLVRMLKRLKAFRETVAPVQATMDDINKQLRVNVEHQRIVNKHLAERNEAWRKLAVAKPAPALYVVENCS